MTQPSKKTIKETPIHSTDITIPDSINKTLRIAYVDEPPFYWTEHNGVKGADIELAEAILQTIGVSSIEYHLVTFDELLPGVQAGKWDMNVPIFVTAERAKDVDFSIPVWSLGDGFVVQKGNPKALAAYEDILKSNDAMLGLIPGQIQFDAAKLAGVSDNQIILFKNQPEAIAALLSGKIDAFAATTVGNTAIVNTHPELETVPFENNKEIKIPVGAFSFSKDNQVLLQAVNKQLRKYLGSENHRTNMAKYGITKAEIDGIVPGGSIK